MIAGHDGRVFHVFNMWDEEVSLAWESPHAREDASLLKPYVARELGRLLIAAADAIDNAGESK